MIFSRDARAPSSFAWKGTAIRRRSSDEIGEELIGRVTQQYAYHRIVSEAKERHMTIVGEELSAEDQTVKIRVP